MNRYCLYFLPIFFLTALSAEAQRNVTYQDLANRSDQPNIYTSYLILPTDSDSALFAANFRMDYALLPFRRIGRSVTPPDGNKEYFSVSRMNLEIFKGDIGRRGQSFEPVTRSSWADTAWAETYDKTQSQFEHLEGSISTKLQPGSYNLFLELNRGETERQTRSRERSFEVEDFKKTEKGTLALLESYSQDEASIRFRLINFGEFALYGEDYKLLILFPFGTDASSYTLTASTIHSRSGDSSVQDTLFTKNITREELLFTDGFRKTDGSKKPEFYFNRTDSGYQAAIVDIPARTFPNRRYLLQVTAEGAAEPLAEKTVSSRWIDMPVSLLNLNVAIDMLKFIVDEDQLRRMRRGSEREREKKFREFWAERDPTPDTEFNELMKEYYSRIDYAYDNFTTLESPGFESDRGRTYILRGAPLRKERTFPAGAPTREVWVYRNSILVFESTSGVGNFRLVEERERN